MRFMNTAKIAKTITQFILMSLIVFLILTNVIGNTYRLIVDRGFFIPSESSLLWFESTVENSGSGEWWIYGEDNEFYFANATNLTPTYYIFPREKVSQCQGFAAKELNTWCHQYVRKISNP